MAGFFADRSTAEVAEQARQRGIPISAVASPAEALQNPQFQRQPFRGALCQKRFYPGALLAIVAKRSGLR